MLRSKQLLAVAILLSAVVATVNADFFLQERIDVGAYFGVLGNNPITLASDGTYAYIGGYTSSATPVDIGILKINLTDPNDATALAGGTQTVQQFRTYGGMFVRNGVLYALCDRPDNTLPSTNVRAINTSTGALVDTFDGDFGTGDGIVYEPAGMTVGATGGLAFDPGFGGADGGVSLLGYGSGRRVLLDIADGATVYDTSDGMIVTDITGTCTVSDASAWRDHVYDADGNIYMRRSNQVQKGIRNGGNSLASYSHLTDELNSDGTPKVGCGDGMPVALRVAPFILGQNIELIPASSAGTDEDVLIFNDRPITFPLLDGVFADLIHVIATDGSLPSTPVQLLNSTGGVLDPASVVPNGAGLYDFCYLEGTDQLLVLDFSARALLVFGTTGAPCPGDLDGDNDVDLADLALLLGAYQGSGITSPGGDLDGDGDTDLQDLAALLAVYGTTC